MDKIAAFILLSVSSMLGVKSTPEKAESWQFARGWHECGSAMCFEASSEKLVEECKRDSGQFILFPWLLHSSSAAYLDNRLIEIAGSTPDFQRVKSFYGKLVLSCQMIQNGDHTLTWKVRSYSKYFARFPSFPKIEPSYPIDNLFNETFNVGAACILLVFALVTLIVLYRKEPNIKILRVHYDFFLT